MIKNLPDILRILQAPDSQECQDLHDWLDTAGLHYALEHRGMSWDEWRLREIENLSQPGGTDPRPPSPPLLIKGPIVDITFGPAES